MTVAGVGEAKMEGLLQWTGEEYRDFGQRPQVTRHPLCQMDMFSERELVGLLDSYPRKRLQAFTMGTDPLRKDEWEPVEVGSFSGKEIMAAVECGRLWLNILHVEMFDSRYRDLLDSIYSDLDEHCPGLAPEHTEATLLISSPEAQVYYHADATFNMLWHIHGEKRFWVYPACDFSFLSQDLLEDIFASTMDEEVPYSPEFDRAAVDFLLKPGDALSWPHNSPHRIVNQRGINVSLSTIHKSDLTERRKQIYVANRLVRRYMGLRRRSTRETGPIAYGKRFLIRAAKRLVRRADPVYEYRARWRIDPSATDGMTALPNPVRTQFSG